MSQKGYNNGVDDMLSQSEGEKQRLFASLEPYIAPSFTCDFSSALMEEARHKIIDTLLGFFPDDHHFEDAADFVSWIAGALPLIQWTQGETLPDCFSILLLCKPEKRLSGENLFLEHIRYGFGQEKRPVLLSFFQYFFHFKGISPPFFIAKARLIVEDQDLHSALKTGLPSWSQKLQFVLQNPTYAPDLMKIRQIAYSGYSPPLFQVLAGLIEKYPQEIEEDVYQDLSYFFAHTSPEFRAQRSPKTLIRILYSHHFLRKALVRNYSPQKQQVLLRCLRSELSFPFGTKTALGIAAAVHLPSKYDYFDEHSLFLTVQEKFPEIQSLHRLSYFPDSNLRLLYIELGKNNGTLFSCQERNDLINHLKKVASAKIERLTPAIFIERNEEEIMKNLLVLSRELKRKSDKPQVMIQLEKQTLQELFFTVTLVRILRGQEISLQDQFSQTSPEVEFIPNRVRIIGSLGKKWAKEANVFQLRLTRAPFLRTDSSTHFYLAREYVVNLLEKTVGPIRDYNGGFIFLQGDVLTQLKNRFPQTPRELIENFFYSLSPIEMQVTLPLELLISLFEEVLRFIETSSSHQFFSTSHYALALFRKENLQFKETIKRHLHPNGPTSRDYIDFSCASPELAVQGHLFLNVDSEQHKRFFLAIQQAQEEWTKKTASLKILRLDFQDWPYSLDPRLGGDTPSFTVLKLLYEGLTRKEKDGSLTLAVAEKFTISDDLRTYTFKLRNTFWSNGDPVVAYDFEYAWKKILSPHFATPFAHLFYLIKNAQAVKEGRLPLNEVKISSPDASTLIVTLEAPSSYLLELLLHPIFSPVHHRIDFQHPHWSSQNGEHYVCNGPFCLHKTYSRWGRYELVKNLHYWDVGEIQLDAIHFIKANSRVALEMFLKNEIDWLGGPLRSWGTAFTQAKQPLETYDTPAIQWYVFNTQIFPFHNKKIRQAIAQVIDRKELSNLHEDARSPSITPLPWSHTQHGDRAIPCPNPELAQDLFNQALQEMGISFKDFPILTLSYTHEERRRKIAQTIKAQIENALGIQCQIEGHSWEVHFDKMIKGKYQLGAIGWTAPIDDPLYTLNVFRSQHERINFAKWENATYQKCLSAANRELNKKKRQHHLAEAEAILMEEVPLIPIAYEVKQFIRKPYIQLPSSSFQEGIDFKWLTIRRT